MSKELIQAYDDYIDFLSKNPAESIAFVHGFHHSKENIENGKAFREKISLLKSLPAQDEQCNNNHLNIDDLLSEFKRQGFNTENWDGEEGAEKAIVDGVRNHIANLTPAQDDKIKWIICHIGYNTSGKFHIRKYGSLVCSNCFHPNNANFQTTEEEFDKLEKFMTPAQDDKLAELKRLTIENLLNVASIDEPYLVVGRESYTRRELAAEIQNNTKRGLDTLNNLLQLTIDLLQRGKLKYPAQDDKQDGWVSVEDRLPPERKGWSHSETVNIFNGDVNIPSTGAYSYSENEWTDFLYTGRKFRVTHWQPLPPQPIKP